MIAEQSITRHDPASEHEYKNAQRQEAMRAIRPMALPRGWAEETDEVFNNINKNVLYRLPEFQGPEGNEREILQPTIDDILFETYTDEKGLTRTRRRTPQEVDEITRRFVFGKAFEDEQRDLLDLLPWRIKVAWRIVREIGRIKGLLNDDETIMDGLAVATTNTPDPWSIPGPPNAQPNTLSQTPAIIWQECRAILERADHLAPGLQSRFWDDAAGKWEERPGLAITPPPVPMAWLDEAGQITDDYNPEHDPGLCLHVSLLKAVTKRLFVESGSREDPDQGRYGMMGLLDERLVRLAWPTRLQIIAWEEMLVSETLELLVSGSVLKATTRLHEKYGLLQREVLVLTRLAQAQAIKLTAGGIEEVRAVMVLRLDRYIERSRDNLDIRGEIQGLKQLGLVQGLTQEQADNTLNLFVDKCREIGFQRQAVRAELPSGQIIDAVG